MLTATLHSSPSRLLKATINYANTDSELVYDQRQAGPGPTHLLDQVNPQSMSIEDGRTLQVMGEKFSLDIQGFELVKPQLTIDLHQFDDALLALDDHAADRTAPTKRDDLIRREWYPAIETWIAKRLGAARVLTFDHTLRAQPSAEGPTEQSRSRRSPVKTVHNDYTPWSADRQLRQTLPEHGLNTADFPRYKFINLWLPLLRTVKESPLAMADLRSVAEADFHKMRLIYPEREGQISVISANPKHRWIWFSDMQPGEGLLLRVFDSEHQGPITGVPHTAFDLPDSSSAPRRTSIELRTIALFND
ncbi:CmcJ/NvfI family oxidoreductase [Microbulbifer sp. ANSA001]|uniref:CmcJ/NvfI family oxidoreductase n=1 Tax=Microbulbifer sp. ANSA001 TaxID=3243358 RepID=UPI0040430539